MKRFVELSCLSYHDENYNLVTRLYLKIGVMDLSFSLNDAVRLAILKFFAAPNKNNKLYLELDDIFCPSVRVNGRYVYLKTDTEEVADTFGVKKFNI